MDSDWLWADFTASKDSMPGNGVRNIKAAMANNGTNGNRNAAAITFFRISSNANRNHNTLASGPIELETLNVEFQTLF
jgi:hypothetical protein